MGLSRKRSHSEVPWWESQMPPARIGIESRKVMKFRMPTRLLLMRTIFWFDEKVFGFLVILGCEKMGMMGWMGGWVFVVLVLTV
jgi:hypothetical protein